MIKIGNRPPPRTEANSPTGEVGKAVPSVATEKAAKGFRARLRRLQKEQQQVRQKEQGTTPSHTASSHHHQAHHEAHTEHHQEQKYERGYERERESHHEIQRERPYKSDSLRQGRQGRHKGKQGIHIPKAQQSPTQKRIRANRQALRSKQTKRRSPKRSLQTHHQRPSHRHRRRHNQRTQKPLPTPQRNRLIPPIRDSLVSPAVRRQAGKLHNPQRATPRRRVRVPTAHTPPTMGCRKRFQRPADRQAHKRANLILQARIALTMQQALRQAA